MLAVTSTTVYMLRMLYNTYSLIFRNFLSIAYVGLRMMVEGDRIVDYDRFGYKLYCI